MAEAYNSIHTGADIDQGVSYANGMAVYSTEETVVGRWIDGKPVYRIICRADVQQSTEWQNVNGILPQDIDSVVRIEGYLLIGGTSVRPMAYYRNDNDAFALSVSKESAVIAFSSRGFAGVGTIFLEYTKTTDEATIAVATVDELNNAYDEGVQSA